MFIGDAAGNPILRPAIREESHEAAAAIISHKAVKIAEAFENQSEILQDRVAGRSSKIPGYVVQ